MKKRILSILIVFALIFECYITVSFGASNTRKMITYNVIKKGSVAYCAARRGVYKVNLKSGKVKRIFNRSKDAAYINGGVYSMKLYKNYIYFLEGGPMTDSLSRVKVSGGKSKLLSRGIVGTYVVSKGKIYCKVYDFDKEKTCKKVMNLDGKNKKKTSCKMKMTTKKTNKKGYYVKSVYKGKVNDKNYGTSEKYTDYLVKPSGEKIKLCSYISAY